MPVSLRNRTKVDQSKQEEQKSKAAVQANKSSTKPEKNQINKKIASSQEEQPKLMQTRGKQKQINEMFPKKITNKATIDTTAANSTLQQGSNYSNNHSSSLDLTVISKKRKRDEFEKDGPAL